MRRQESILESKYKGLGIRTALSFSQKKGKGHRILRGKEFQPMILYLANLPTNYSKKKKKKDISGYLMSQKYTTKVTLVKNLLMFMHQEHD